jgi:hypothetical protein
MLDSHVLIFLVSHTYTMALETLPAFNTQPR